MVYWSRDPVPSNPILYENQRPFLQPRLPMHQDAVAVESTSYALLVYLARDGIGDLQERVVTWLNTMRMVDGGFVSIYVILIFLISPRLLLFRLIDYDVITGQHCGYGSSDGIRLSSSTA
jgi:hypothetical protein